MQEWLKRTPGLRLTSLDFANNRMSVSGRCGWARPARPVVTDRVKDRFIESQNTKDPVLVLLMWTLRQFPVGTGRALHTTPALVLVVAVLMVGQAARAAGPQSNDPLDRWELNFETGILWRVGGRTALNYVVMPQLLTLKTPAVMHRPFAGGDLVLRSRFSLLIEPIIEGPESHYIGGAASGILEWWDHARTRSLFFSSGGGLGLMDSKGYETEGAQGQDLNFNWFIYCGARFRGGERWNASIGVYYQHISNTGLDEINPGMDVIGPMLSVGWKF